MSSNTNTTVIASSTPVVDPSTPSTAESVINAKLRRRWSKVYRRRGKLHLEESIAAFCLATICESNSNRSFRQVVGKVLHNLLATKRSFRTRCSTSGPYPCTRLDNRHRVAAASDSDEDFSGEEDFVHGAVSSSELRKLVEKVVRELDCVRKLPTHLTPRLISPAELDCVLCSRCLLEPVTTRCGHTFCRECLERVLDYGTSCPLCVAPISRADLSRGATAVIERLLRLVVPAEYNERIRARQQEIDSINSQQLPVFVCTTAFPGIACPLFVYEPRYRLLTRRCLQSPGRRFGMAAAAPLHSGEKFSKYGTVLEIKDAVRLQDGCSILTTLGMKRFRVLDTGEKDGYDTASIQYIQDNPVPLNQLNNLIQLHDLIYEKAIAWVNTLNPSIQAEIIQTFGAMPEPELNWHRLPNGPTWTWWLMAILPLGLQLQVGILGTTSLEKRLRAIDKTLEHVNARMSSAISNTSANCEHNATSCEDGEQDVEIADICLAGDTHSHLQNHLEAQQPINL